MMTAGSGGSTSSQENGMEAATETRQRLRPWLISRLDSKTVPNLEWVDKKDMIFKIPWKHGGKQDWDPRQAEIFKEWAVHTGKYREGIDNVNYAKWKTNLRCALNKAPDIKEITEMTRKDEPNPYKVYKFLEKKKRGGIPIIVPPDDQPPPQNVGADVLPTFVEKYTSSGSNSSGQRLVPEPMFGNHMLHTGHSAAMTGDLAGRLPSDLGDIDSPDLMHMSGSGPRLSDALSNSQENMDFEEANNSPASQSSSDFTPHVPPYNEGSLLPTGESTQQLGFETKYTPPLFTVSDVPTQHSDAQDTHGASAAYGQQQKMCNVLVKPEQPSVPFDTSMTSHECNSKAGFDMYLEVLYRSNIVNTHHISAHTKGCRITHSALSNLSEQDLPDIFRDALFGADSSSRQVVDLPSWPPGLCPESLLPSIIDLLKNMQRGLILECKHGDILATRLCKTTVYYSSCFTSNTMKLARHDDSIQVTKIFDMDNNFKPALTNYDRGQGMRPSPYVYLYIGQNGAESDLASLLIVIRLTSCRALQMLNDVDEQRCYQHSMHISASNELDQLGDCFSKQLQQDKQ